MPIPSPVQFFKKIFSPAKGKEGAAPAKKEGSIGLYGLSKAGKTVFFTVAFRESALDIRAKGRFRLTTTHPDTLREMQLNRKLLEGTSPEYGRPIFPPPTQVSRLFHFDAHISNRYIYPFRTMDYKGEGLDLTRSLSSQETVEFLSSCHCLLFLYEPDEQMLDRGRDDLEINEDERMRRIELFITMIESLRRSGDRPRLDMPIGLIITKADRLEGFQALADDDTVLLNRKLANMRFAGPADFIRKVLDQPHVQQNPHWQRQLRRILTGLTLFWEHVLTYAPTFQVFFVSSTGGTQTIENERGETEVVPPRNFKSKGILAPLHWVVEMLEFRRKIHFWRGLAWRLALLSVIVHVVIGVISFKVLDQNLGVDLKILETSSKETNPMEKRWKKYYFYPTLRSQILTVCAAVRIKNNLQTLNTWALSRSLVTPAATDKNARSAAQLDSLIRADARTAQAGDLENRVSEVLELLSMDLSRSVRHTIDAAVVAPKPVLGKEPDETVRRIGDYYCIPPGGSEAVDYYNASLSGNKSQFWKGKWDRANGIARSDSVECKADLMILLEDLVRQFKEDATFRIPGAQLNELQIWQLDLSETDTMTLPEAAQRAQKHRIPFIEAIVRARLQGPGAGGGGGGGAGAGAGACIDATLGLDTGYLQLATFMQENRSDPLQYFVAGMRRARTYLSSTKDRTEPGIEKNRANADAFARAMDRWEKSGIPASIQVVDAGGYMTFFEVVGEGDQVKIGDPHPVDQAAAVTWRLGEARPGPGRGLRLYFSPSQNKPAGSEALESPLTVTVGMPELLSHRAVSVGRAQKPVTLKLLNPEVLPSFGGLSFNMGETPS